MNLRRWLPCLDWGRRYNRATASQDGLAALLRHRQGLSALPIVGAAGQHLIRRDRLGVPQSARDVFALLARAGRIEQELAAGLQRMVGFRNIAVHDYQSLQLPITVAIIEKHLDEFLQYSKALLLHDAV